MGAIDPTSIAEINATVLSLLIGSGFVYGQYVHSTLEKHRLDVFQAARKVNELRISGLYGIGKGWADYLKEHPSSRGKSLERVVALVMHGSTGGRAELAERGEELVRELSRLSAASPFPESASPSDSGGASHHASEPTPVEFRSVEQVREWLQVAQRLSGELLWLYRVHRGKFDVLIEAFSSQWQERHVRDDLPVDLKDSLRAADPKHHIRHFMDKNVAKLRSITVDVKDKLECLDTFEARVPSKRKFLFMIGAAGFVFASGVLLPLFEYYWIPLFVPSASFIFYFVIPAGFYMMVFLGLMMLLSSRWR